MINELEQEAMKLLLSGEDQMLAALRAQYENSNIKAMEFTGVGVYINYEVPDSAQNLPRTLSCQIGDVEGQISSLEHGAGFLLWVKNGTLAFLEIYTYDEPWPDEITGFKLGYIGGTRNIDELKRNCVRSEE